MCPIGLNRHGGLVDKREVGVDWDKRHYKVDNYNNWNANPLHMNTHSFWNNCNQYIYLRSVFHRDLFWKVCFRWRVCPPSLSLSWLQWIVQSNIPQCCYRIDVLAVVVLHVQWYRIPSCRLVISIKDLFLFCRFDSLRVYPRGMVKNSAMGSNLSPLVIERSMIWR
jgi:hypothetical protein